MIVSLQERIAAIMKHYEADKEKLQKIRALLVSSVELQPMH